MKRDGKDNQKNDLQRKINVQNINKSYIILYLVVFAIIVIGEIVLASTQEFSFIDLFKDTIGNLMGVLAAFLIFDIFHEKISKDSYASEMSQQILETLMANPEALDLFTPEQKKNFMEATIKSIVDDDDATEMINNNIQNYLKGSMGYRIRTHFDYKFEIDESLPAVYNFFEDKSQYFYVQEILNYEVKYLSQEANNTNTDEVKIGFVFDNKSLDNVLREQKSDADFEKCIFREALDIRKEDLDKLRALSAEDFKKKFMELFKVDVQIDRCSGKLVDVALKDKGIIAKYRVGHDVNALSHVIRIIFHMPKQWGTLLEVALVDPTKGPKITVSYPEDIMDVEMFSFLSKGEESSLEVAHEQNNGIYDIALNTEWIYPISGMVFSVCKKEIQEETEHA